MYENIRGQRAYSLIEVSFVLIVVGMLLLGGQFFYEQISLFISSDLISKQFIQIANGVAEYSWPEPSEPKQRIYEYDVEKLKELGVISANANFEGNEYVVDLYWDSKTSYTMFVYLKTKDKNYNLEKAKIITELLGEDGGWLDFDNNGGIHVLKRERDVFIEDELGFLSEIKKLPQYTPFLIKHGYIYRGDDRSVFNTIKETFFEWGKETKENEIIVNKTQEENDTNIDWSPAYIDDRIVIAWGDEKTYKVTIKDKDITLSKYTGTGRSFSLFPISLWIGKEITLFIQVGMFSFERKYDVKSPSLEKMMVTTTYQRYGLIHEKLTGLDNLNIKEDDIVIEHFSPLIVCLSQLNVSSSVSSESYGRFLIPLSYNIFLSYNISGQAKNISVSQGALMSYPFRWVNEDLLSLSYENTTSSNCGILSDKIDTRLHVSVDIVFYWLNGFSHFEKYNLGGFYLKTL